MRIKCLRCGSTKLISDVELGQVGFNYAPFVRVIARPEALLRKRVVMRFLKARVCANCGTVDYFVEDPEELSVADKSRRATTRRPRY